MYKRGSDEHLRHIDVNHYILGDLKTMAQVSHCKSEKHQRECFALFLTR